MTGVQQKLFGKRLAAKKVPEDLAFARLLARNLGKTRPAITIESVREVWRLYRPKWTLGNAAGSVFDNHTEWECVGFVAATRPEARGRMIRQWRRRN